MDELLKVKAETSDQGQRIDKFLTDNLPELSRSRIQKLIDEGRLVRTDGGASLPVTKAGDRIKGTESFILSLPPPEPLDVEAEDIPLEIIYEDEDLLVVNKPRGMVVHPAPGNYSGTLVNALLYHFQGHLSGINGVMRPGIVHRIDKDTAGLLVVCKTDRAHQGMAELLKVHDIDRVYHAIVYGNISGEEGTVDAPLGRDPQDRKKMAVRSDGRRAVTHYHVLERFGSFTYLEARLETGRTHQIRVHMKSLGHPLLGDVVYGPAKVSGQAAGMLSGVRREDIAGQMLVAKVLGFTHPVTGETLRFEAPLPDYFERVLQSLRRE
ncbi:MAG: RluA family pseudouridine synthase [Firmicutes bacterium]|nr:RluA family pseudouridine synthase [Bacillota bacterium]